MAHWHDFNPWAAEIVYLPSMEEFALCHGGLNKIWDCSATGGSAEELMTMDKLIDHMLNNARIKQDTTDPKVDPYILPQPTGRHSLGLRIGPNPEDYHSPDCNREIAAYFIRKYRHES